MSGPSISLREDSYPENREPYEWQTHSTTVTGTDPTALLTAQANWSTLFSKVPRAHHIKILVDGTTYIRLNSATNDVITITTTTPYETFTGIITKIYVATNNAGVNITVQMD